MQPQSQAKAVLFDFDGTLGRSLSSWTSAYQESLREVGIDLDVGAVRANLAHQAAQLGWPVAPPLMALPARSAMPVPLDFRFRPSVPLPLAPVTATV